MNQNQGRARARIILFFLFVFMGVLLWRLYGLTIKQGAYFRKISETKRMKEIQVTAPRGNIYDRNGVLLAGTRASFAVQGFKDDFSGLEKTERNEILRRLISYVEKDGADYYDRFPLEMNCFVYPNAVAYLNSKQSPTSMVEDLLRDHQLIGEWLSMVYEDSAHPNYRVSPAARALNSLSLKGSALPIRCDASNHFSLSFLKNESYQEMVQKEEIKEGQKPLDLLAQKVSDNQNILSQVLDHPACRTLAYEVLKKHNLTGQLLLRPYVYTYLEELQIRKAGLHRQFPAITMTSTAKDDFQTIVKNKALDNFLSSIQVQKDNKFLIPAEKLLNKLADLGVKTNLKYEISEDASKVSLVFQEPEKTKEVPLERLKRLAYDHKLIDSLIVDDECKVLAEKAMFAEGIYPGISINEWTYGLEKEQNDFEKRYDLVGKGAQAAFQQLKEKNGIVGKNNPMEDLGTMVILSRILSQGDYAYSPVNICYELSPRTVAEIEETIPAVKGIMVSKEPIRYYPYGESACHILGYIGKISSQSEIDKYIKEKNYLPSQLVGKTGVEESFEDTLHGVNGTEKVLIDSYGNRTEKISRTDPKAGNSLYLTIDIHFQQQAEKSLKNSILSVKHGLPYDSSWGLTKMQANSAINSGATVSIDPNNGELLAMASNPSYDPNLFVTGISGSDWAILAQLNDQAKDEPKPLMNLATQTAVQPGSTFKLFSALTGLEKGLNPKKTANCTGYMMIGNQKFGCWIYNSFGGSHGPLNLYDAIGKSCNYYFYTLALGMDPKGNSTPGVHVTIDELNKMVMRMGLGESTGLEINVPREAKNSLPSRQGKLGLTKALLKKYLNENLKKYKKTDAFKNQSDIDKDIATIVSWADRGSDMGRSEVIRELEALGYNAEIPQEKQRAGLADILKYTYLNQSGWTQADSLNTIIGQGQNGYSPLSLVKAVSIIANQGTRYKLTLVKEIRKADGKTPIFQQQPSGSKVEIAASSFKAVREGMRRSAEGNAVQFAGLPFTIGAKSGTAERDGTNPVTKKDYTPYAWEVAFAPFDQPKICTVSFLPEGMASANAVPLARDMIAAYLKVPANRTANEAIYKGKKTYYSPKDGTTNEKQERNEASRQE